MIWEVDKWKGLIISDEKTFNLYRGYGWTIYLHHTGRQALIHLKNGVSAKQLKSMLIREEGEDLQTHRKRKVPHDRPLDIPAIVRIPKARHRQLGVKWTFGRFPPLSTTVLEEKFGGIVGKHLRELHILLAKYSLNESKMRATEASLDQLLFFTIVYFETWNGMSRG